MRRAQRSAMAAVLAVTGAAAAALGANGCASEECVPTQQYFAEEVWSPILSQKCIGCHNPLGAAKDSKMVLKSASDAGFLDANLEILRDVAGFEKDGVSILLLKPSGTITHGGNQVIKKDSNEYKALEGLVQKFKEPEDCKGNTASTFVGLALDTPVETLRKACIALGGRLPTEAEEKKVAEGGMEALDGVLEQLMTEENFYTRIKEIYNDAFLTDRYANNDAAVDLLGNVSSYDPHWYDQITDPSLIQFYGAYNFDHLIDKLRHETNQAIAREPVELVAYVVRNERPFGEILTADYLAVNPFSAKAWGMADVEFKNPADPFEWKQGQIKEFPHAGVLTSPMVLTRHPTTPTNRNRHRARMVYQWFLGTDILKTAERPIDPTSINDFNPTMNNPSCTVCHAALDPIAGAFHTFGALGEYVADDTWLEDMRAPGFGKDFVPFDEFPRSTQWLADAIVADPRFSLAAVFIAYQGLTGQPPLQAPADSKAPGYSDAFNRYVAQYDVFAQIAREFEAADQNYKVIVKGIIKSPYFRAKNCLGSTVSCATSHPETGMGRFLIPEALNRKITAVMGYPWRRNVDQRDYLLDRDQLRLLFGGIDSDDVTTRITSPNGVMANIAERMANEMACWAAPRDFTLAEKDRKLFPHVKLSFTPEDENGFPVEPAVAAIKKNIQYLHHRLLGETLADDDPELLRTYQLFFDTWKEGMDAIADAPPDAPYPTELHYECRATNDWWTGVPLPEERQVVDDSKFTVRAWMAVITYLLSDYSFLHE